MANRHIRLEDFLILWSQKVGKNTSPNTMRGYLEGFIKAILDELKLNGEVYIHNFGTFRIAQVGGETKKIGDPINGGTRYVFCKPKLRLSFTPSEVVNRMINENDYEMFKKPSKRKFTSQQSKNRHNELRRKEKPSLESLLCDMLNESEKKKNGETQI